VDNVTIIAFVISVMILVLFDEFVMSRMVFPLTDYIKYLISKSVDLLYKEKEIKAKWAHFVKRYIAEIIATALFIVYCYVGYAILGEYVIAPILTRWQAILLPVVILLFVLANYMINSPKMRRRLFGMGIYNPEKKKKV
jgi:hypothetical protein